MADFATVDFAGLGDLRLAPDDLHLVLPEKAGDAAVQAAGNTARALHHGGGIEGHIVRREAIVLGMFHVVIDFRGAQQRLGGNAAPVQADAAQMFALDDGRLEAKLCGADGRHIAAGAGADDENVETVVGHEGVPFQRN